MLAELKEALNNPVLIKVVVRRRESTKLRGSALGFFCGYTFFALDGRV